jgi:hypothetical protein
MLYKIISSGFFLNCAYVFAQANIGSEQSNVIYRGLPNPVSVACGNKDSFFIKEKSATLEVKNEYGRLYLNCLNVKEDSAFIVFGLQNSTLQRKFVFPVENIPEPKIRLGALDLSKNISKSALMVQQSMVAILENFIYDGVKYKVTGYRMKYFDYATLQIKTIDVDGSSLAPIKPALSQLNSGDRFEFSNIHILAPDNKTIQFSNILIEIN